MEVKWNARRLTTPADYPVQVASVRCPDELAKGWNLDNEDLLPMESDHFSASGEGWMSSVSDERLDAERVGSTILMAGAGATHATVIFHSDQQPPRAIVTPVREANDGFDEFAVGKRSCFLALELHGKRFSSLHKISEELQRQ